MPEELLVKPAFDLAEFNRILETRYFDGIFRNSDYYSFLVQLCQKREYDLSGLEKKQDTFLEGILSGMLRETGEKRYRGLRFRLELLSDLDLRETAGEELVHGAAAEGRESVTANIRFVRL